MKGKQMKKKKIIWYAALIVGISILSIMGPRLIHHASGMLLERIGGGNGEETEETLQTESEGLMASFGIPDTEAETEAGSPSTGHEASGNENSGKESSGGGTSTESSSASSKSTAASDQQKKEVYEIGRAHV